MTMQGKRLIGIVLTVALLLFVPLIAMRFTDEVSWSLFDFVVAGGLLLCTGLMCELAIMKVQKLKHRIVVCGVILITLLMLWVELAVGISGTPIVGN